MSSTNLIRWSGLALALGGIVYPVQSLILTSIGGIRAGAAAVLTPTWVIGQSLHFVGAILVLFGIVGISARQIGKSGRLGLAAFVVALLGVTLDVGAGWVQAYILPTVVSNQPALVARGGAWFSASPILFAFALHDLVGAIGYLLVGMVMLRAVTPGVPRWAAVLVIVGAIPYGLPVFLIPAAVKVIGSLALGAGLAGLGYALWAPQLRMAAAPAR